MGDSMFWKKKKKKWSLLDYYDWALKLSLKHYSDN